MHQTDVINVDDAPGWSEVAVRRPLKGLLLLGGSVVFTIAILIFLGAWLADNRIDERAEAAGDGLDAEGDWWEDGLIAVCPIH